MEALRSSVPEASTSFLPHVTLLSGLTSEDGWTQEKILNTTLEAIRDWRLERDELLDCIKCELLDVTTRGMYFQCILLALVPNDRLLSLNNIMRSAFHQADQPAYFPHASLLYSPMTEQEAKARIAKMEEERIFKRSKNAAGEERVAFGTQAGKGINHLDLVAVELWDSNGSVGEWKKLETICLAQPEDSD